MALFDRGGGPAGIHQFQDRHRLRGRIGGHLHNEPLHPRNEVLEGADQRDEALVGLLLVGAQLGDLGGKVLISHACLLAIDAAR